MEINKDNWKQIDLNVDSLFAYENLRKDYIGFAPPKKLSIMSIAL